MATNHTVIKTALKTLYDDAKSTPMSEDDFAARMATIIQDAIQSGDVVNVEPGTATISVT